VERMQNLGKHLGFHEDAKKIWLGYWEFGMPMGFWGFPLFLVSMKGGWEVLCWELVPLICFHKC